MCPTPTDRLCAEAPTEMVGWDDGMVGWNDGMVGWDDGMVGWDGSDVVSKFWGMVICCGKVTIDFLGGC